VTTTGKATTGRKQSRWYAFYGTDLAKKYAMAISGILGLLFVFFHMVGNLHAFEGTDAATGEPKINEYGEALRDIGEPLAPRSLILWLFLRLPLIIALIVHVWAAYSLTRTSLKARGDEKYDERHYIAVDYASRTMRWGGVIILAFLAWHLADLTWGVEFVNPDFVRGDIAGNLEATFSRWPVVVFYVIAMGALGLHIWHGGWSLFQTLGINNPTFNKWRNYFAYIFATVVAVGFVTVPLAVAFGIIG